MTIRLTTERLTLRRFTAADEDRLLALHSDPAVMRYLGRPSTRADIRDDRLPYYLGLYDRFPGFGYWAAIETATGEFLGWFLFRPPDGSDTTATVELGYRLHTAAWDRGVATEGARALVEDGFTTLGVERVVADTMAVNTGSRRVLEKVGLRFVRVHHEEWDDPLDGAGHGEVCYELTRDEWSRARRAASPGPGAATRPR